MQFKVKIYSILVNNVPGIRERYHIYRNNLNGTDRIKAWIYLVWLNFSYYVLCRRELKYTVKYPLYEKKKLYFRGSESSLSKRETPREFAEKLSGYDVISFDVFDTLIFRPFSNPSDLFYFVSDKLNYMDFQRIRCEMEEKTRKELYQREKSVEVTLEEIYKVIERETGIKAEKGIQAELSAEYRFCFGNPYMLEVVEELRRLGKRIIITSDMYLREEYIKHILSKSGYGEFDACYISCEYRKSKNSGELYDTVKEKEGIHKRYVHIGDNVRSDAEQAEKHGFMPFYYKNVNKTGMKYRAEDMSVIVGSMYRGIVNANIHNGLTEYTVPYEYGFIYGGLFVLGYCGFIYEYVKSNNIEKLLFLARDGDIISRVYGMMYPGENTEYVYWSRLAAAKMAASGYRYDYFRRFLFHKVNQNYTLESIFKSMELEDMLENFCLGTKLGKNKILTDGNVNTVKEYLLDNWDRVLKHYDEQVNAGGLYYARVLNGCKKAAAVDIGWAGSGSLMLGFMVNEVWKLDCKITGIIAGTNSCSDYDRNISTAQLENGCIVSYMFSQWNNRDLWKYHDSAKKHNLYWELLLTSSDSSFKGFYDDGCGGYKICFKDNKYNVSRMDAIKEIQRGILDFVQKYIHAVGIENVRVCGRDAYAAMMLAENRVNEKVMRKMMELLDNKNVE